MGLSLYKRSDSSYSTPNAPTPLPPNPNPNRYNVLRYVEEGNWLLIEVQYPDCTTYEGRKILLYYQTTYKRLKAQKSIDPHFSNNTTMISPFARFVPNEGGWNAAKRLIQYYSE